MPLLSAATPMKTPLLVLSILLLGAGIVSAQAPAFQEGVAEVFFG